MLCIISTLITLTKNWVWLTEFSPCFLCTHVCKDFCKHFYFFFWDKVFLCSLGWSETQYVAQVGLKLEFLRSPPSKFEVFGYEPPHVPGRIFFASPGHCTRPAMLGKCCSVSAILSLHTFLNTQKCELAQCPLLRFCFARVPMCYRYCSASAHQNTSLFKCWGEK